MKCNIDEVLKFEMFDDGFPRLTEKNVRLINFIINNDSNYRNDSDENHISSTKYWSIKFKENPNKENLKEFLIALDKHNSTHLYTSKNKKNGKYNLGIDNIVNYIDKNIGLENLETKIKEKETGYKLVDEIANKANSGLYIISPASKIVTYLSRYMNNDDLFSIYDNVVAQILPYYYYEYVIKTKLKINDKIIEEKIKINKKIIKEKKYHWYCDIIDIIIIGVEKEEKYKISRKDFDYLLWYYYKGDKDIKDDKKNTCYKSRTTRALENIK